jgi:hypothetical protein
MAISSNADRRTGILRQGVQERIRATVRSTHGAAKCAPLSGNKLITLDAIVDSLVTERDRLVDGWRDEARGHEGDSTSCAALTQTCAWWGAC